MNKSVTIKGELFWTRDMNNFNTKFNPDNTKYQCTIGNIDLMLQVFNLLNQVKEVFSVY